MIRGLGDYKKEEKKGKKKTTEAYAGGDQSGIAVENDDIESIVQKARVGRNDDLPRESDGKPKTELRIKLYSNGF